MLLLSKNFSYHLWMDWFLYDWDIRHERIKPNIKWTKGDTDATYLSFPQNFVVSENLITEVSRNNSRKFHMTLLTHQSASYKNEHMMNVIFTLGQLKKWAYTVRCTKLNGQMHTDFCDTTNLTNQNGRSSARWNVMCFSISRHRMVGVIRGKYG